MLKPLLLILFFLSALDARENPFFPVDSAQDIPVTTNQVQNIPPLKRVSIELPSTARVLESVTVRYKNLDGSISSKTTEFEHSVDWHLPLFISQHFCDEDTKSSQVFNRYKQGKKPHFKELLKLPFIRFYAYDKTLKITTKDKLLRDFLLVKPHRIVCDFQKDIDIRSYVKKIPKGVFKKIRIGTHKGYYRVVIELDGYYNYSMKKTNDGYLFVLH